jgi:ATP-binding cassette, subfamily B (MDR/TAP), member 1
MTILRQDIAFFDTETTTGVIGRMSGGTVLIQDAIGEKVGGLFYSSSLWLSSFLKKHFF